MHKILKLASWLQNTNCSISTMNEWCKFVWRLVMLFPSFLEVMSTMWNQTPKPLNFFFWDFQRNKNWTSHIWTFTLHVPDHCAWGPALHPGCQLRLPPAHTHVLLPLWPVLCGHLLHLHHHPQDAVDHPNTEQSCHYEGFIIQIYFIILLAVFDVFLLTIMAYDRYVAICHPLHYMVIMSPWICGPLVLVSWIISFLNSLLHILMMLHLSSVQTQKSLTSFVSSMRWSNLPVQTPFLITWWCTLQLSCWVAIPLLESFTLTLR